MKPPRGAGGATRRLPAGKDVNVVEARFFEEALDLCPVAGGGYSLHLPRPSSLATWSTLRESSATFNRGLALAAAPAAAATSSYSKESVVQDFSSIPVPAALEVFVMVVLEPEVDDFGPWGLAAVARWRHVWLVHDNARTKVYGDGMHFQGA